MDRLKFLTDRWNRLRHKVELDATTTASCFLDLKMCQKAISRNKVSKGSNAGAALAMVIEKVL